MGPSEAAPAPPCLPCLTDVCWVYLTPLFRETTPHLGFQTLRAPTSWHSISHGTKSGQSDFPSSEFNLERYTGGEVKCTPSYRHLHLTYILFPEDLTSGSPELISRLIYCQLPVWWYFRETVRTGRKRLCSPQSAQSSPAFQISHCCIAGPTARCESPGLNICPSKSCS